MILLYGLLSIFTENKTTHNVIYIPICVSLLFIIVSVNKRLLDRKSKIENNVFELDLYMNNKNIRIKGYLDTGNSLKNPYNGNPVIILNPHILIHFLSKAGYECITEYQRTGIFPYERLKKTDEIKCFPLPYRTISSNFELMPAFYLQKIILADQQYTNITAGISKETFMDKMNCQVLLHESLKPNREEKF